MSSPSDISVRGHDLAGQIIGHMTFTELFLLDLNGERPSAEHVRVVDGILVTLMEHGLTPSTLATRLALEGAPESLQGAIAAGLLAVGSRFLGVIENVATLLQRVACSGEFGSVEFGCRREVERIVEAGELVPGLGHNLLAEADPRVTALLTLSDAEGVSGVHVAALPVLRDVACEVLGRELIVNATGAVGAILSDLSYPPDAVRGFALVARCAGLFAHAVQERQSPLARGLWEQMHEIRTTE